jgi:putative NADH-flavin reductase
VRLTILGSTGLVGKVLLAKALEAGHQVKTLVRDPAKLGEYRERVEQVVGDAADSAAVESAVAGSEAILSTIAPPQRNPGDPRRYEQAMKHVLCAMEANGRRRIIHIGGAGYAVVEGEEWTLRRRLLRVGLLLFAKPILEAKWLEWQALKASSLDWTLLRPPAILARAPAGRLFADERRLPNISVNLFDFADFMLEQATSLDWIRKCPLVSSGGGCL